LGDAAVHSRDLAVSGPAGAAKAREIADASLLMAEEFSGRLADTALLAHVRELLVSAIPSSPPPGR